jgi:hypothetical protein
VVVDLAVADDEHATGRIEDRLPTACQAPDRQAGRTHDGETGALDPGIVRPAVDQSVNHRRDALLEPAGPRLARG